MGLTKKRKAEERKEEKREKLRRKVEGREMEREVTMVYEDEWMTGEVGNGLWEEMEDNREEEERRRRDQDREDDDEVRRILEGGCRFETLLGETQSGEEKVKVWMEKMKKGIDEEK